MSNRNVTRVIADSEIARLETDRVSFYAHLGWEAWRGPLAGRRATELLPTPDQKGIMILCRSFPLNCGAKQRLLPHHSVLDISLWCGALSIAMIDGVAALVDHSLVRQAEGSDGEPHFMMLEMIRAYGRELLH